MSNMSNCYMQFSERHSDLMSHHITVPSVEAVKNSLLVLLEIHIVWRFSFQGKVKAGGHLINWLDVGRLE